MKISEQFRNEYIRADDLDSPIDVTISRVSETSIGDDDRLLLEFTDHDKSLPLNKTNALALSELFGDETKDWKGERVTLYRDKVMFQGKRVAAVRVRAAQQQPQPPL